MRTTILTAVVLGACLSSCTGTSHGSTNNATASGVGPVTATGEAQIMSQDECDRRAGTGITASNCDSEFDKLVREIEADQDSDG